MAKKIGRLISIGFGKETSRGTVVSIAHWYPWLSHSFVPKITKAINTSARGRIEDADDSDSAEIWAEGTFEAKVRANGVGYLLLSMFGSVADATAAGETVVYEHTYTVAQSAVHQSLTVGVDDDEQDRRYANAVVSKLEFKVEMGDYVKVSADLVSKAAANATLSPSFTADYEFTPKDVVVKIATTEAGLSGATAIPVKSLTLTFQDNVERDQTVGDSSPADILNKQFSAEIEMELLSQDNTYRALFEASTAEYMSIAIKDTSTTIGNAENPELTFTFYKTQITEYDRSGDPDELVMQTLKWKAFYNVSDSKMVQAVLTNTIASY